MGVIEEGGGGWVDEDFVRWALSRSSNERAGRRTFSVLHRSWKELTVSRNVGITSDQAEC
jgi:hypothetical protein